MRNVAGVSPINLSILDFKTIQKSGAASSGRTINLSILDFKSVSDRALETFLQNYKSIHIGF